MIDKNKHYFILMHPLESCLDIFFFTTSTSREKWVECKIVENRYKVSDGYKVELEAIEDGYGTMIFYQLDFESMVKSGLIIEKTNESQHVEEIKWFEHLCGNVFIEHSAYIVTN